jgi:hypothetical protein
MNAKVIIQTNSISGQKNVCFTTDMTAPLENFLVSWPEYTVLSGTVLILDMNNDKLSEALLDVELHSTDTGTESIELMPEEQEKLRAMLEGVINGNS